MKYAVLLFLTFMSRSWATAEHARSMVPHGTIIETLGRDFVIKTKAGSKIGVEFKLNGKFQEASGKNLNQGDELEPGEGLLSLGTVAHKLQDAGLNLKGYWFLEEDKELGWIYEFDGTIIDAKTGKILKKLTVPAPQDAKVSVQ